jgi:hypothetical protein
VKSKVYLETTILSRPFHKYAYVCWDVKGVPGAVS